MEEGGGDYVFQNKELAMIFDTSWSLMSTGVIIIVITIIMRCCELRDELMLVMRLKC